MKVITLIKLTNWSLIIDILGESSCREVWQNLAVYIPSVSDSILHKQIYNVGEIYLINENNYTEKTELNIRTVITKFFQDSLGILTFRLAKIELISYEYKSESALLAPTKTKTKTKKLYSNPIGELKRIIDNKLITPYLQGIYDSNEYKLIGYEALSRGPIDSPLFEANILFSTALLQDTAHELELVCLERMLELVKFIHDDKFISINLSPYMLLDKNVYLLLNAIDNKFKVKLELTEHVFIPCWEKVLSKMNEYRKQGFEFWLDDVGCGYFNFETIKTVNPELTKFSLSIIKDNDIIKELKLITENIHKNKGKVLVEGIENLEQLKLIKDINIDYVQGFLFDIPSEAFKKLRCN